MQKISLENLQFGMKLAKNVYDSNGKMLLSKGKILTFVYIRRLGEMGVPSVYIDSNLSDYEVEIPDDLMDERNRIKAVKEIKNIFENCRSKNIIDISLASSVTTEIVDQLLSRRDVLVQTTDIRTFDNYTYAHSVNVCMLATIIGMQLQYTKPQLRELALGALLHDIGKTQIDVEILNKPGRLTEEEFEEIKTHPKKGFDVLRANTNISLFAMHIAFQHHEKFDGSGYPRGLLGNSIFLNARIVAIADVYDALTANRVYKKACQPHEAYAIMMDEGAAHFDMELLELFFKKIALYPVGTVVQLESGNYAVVIEVKAENPARPIVSLLAAADKSVYQQKALYNLIEKSERIERVLDEKETLQLIEMLKAEEKEEAPEQK